MTTRTFGRGGGRTGARRGMAARRRACRIAGVALAAATVGACDGLLDVRLPGNVVEAELNNPALAAVMAESVIADFECAWNNYVAGTALISDQFIQASGNLNQRNWGTRRVTSDDASYAQSSCAAPYGIYTTLHTARFQAEDVHRRISEFPAGQVANRERLLAVTRVYGGYSLVALGEGFCEMAIDRGPRLSRADVLRLAEGRFTDGLALAQQANNTDLRNMALVGRARVRLNLGDFAGAIADASAVPAGYVKNATRDESSTQRMNAFCNYLTCASFGRHASIAPDYRDVRWEGVADPRIRVTTNNGVAFDNATTHWFPANKFTARTNPVQIASYTEARLIVAEASARTGDLATARTIINALHTTAGIPPFDPGGTATQSEVVRQVIEERRRELFLEGGHRFNDHYRFRDTEWRIPYKGEPGSIHPNGVDHTGVPYGSTTCFALPDVERATNPNL
jgi:hypothetical protein